MEKVTSRFVVSISGPGCRPAMMNAPRSTAIDTPLGIPNAMVGISEPASLALLLLPAAITPSIDPLPKSSGCLDACCAEP
jgi:hypothetical protein